MKTITGFCITGLSLENFRNQVENVHFDCGDMTMVSGHNGVGKTTVAHAICYALYGVGFTGEQKIERLMNEKAGSVRVQLEFADQDGEAHTLIRSRYGDKTTLTLDGFTVQQAVIEQMFGEKDAFLSAFNPLYLPECMGNAGRELLLRYIAPVSKEDVLAALPNHRAALETLPLDAEPPEEQLKQVRAAIRRIEQQSDILQGHIESVSEARKNSEQKLDALYAEKQAAGKEIAGLRDKQFEGIAVEEIPIQRELLKGKLNRSESEEAATVRQKLAQAKGRVYDSKFREPFAEAQAEYNSLVTQYKALVERLKSVKVGDACPTCHMAVTEENLAGYQASLKAECGTVAQKGKGAKEHLQEIAELERKAKEQFEQYKADDIRKLTEELAALTENAPDREQITAELERLDELEKVGHLSETEVPRLHELEATLIGIEAQIKALEESGSEEKLQTLLAEKDAFEEQIKSQKQTVSALTEYVFKRAELASKDFSMPNVTVRLFDVMRSTGEVKSTFKFSYKGRDYSTLSLSEKTLAGMELSALMRTLTGKDYPICIDNTESIAAFGDAALPTQVFLLRVVKGQPLTVKAQSRPAMQKAA